MFGWPALPVAVVNGAACPALVLPLAALEVAATGVKVAVTGVKVAAMGVKVAAMGVKVAATGVKVAATGVKVASTGVKVAATGVKVAATGVKVIADLPTIARSCLRRCPSPFCVMASTADSIAFTLSCISGSGSPLWAHSCSEWVVARHSSHLLVYLLPP